MQHSEKRTLIGIHNRILPYIHNTPVLTSTNINKLVGADLYFKCENFQKMGAFKMRGATNAVLNLSEIQRNRGVVTHSSGNFAQALSLAATSLNVTAYIVMPNNAPKVKKDAVKGYKGIITECESTIESRVRESQLISKETGATFIHPSNDLDVIHGQATAAMELLYDYHELDAIIVPVGGGGLIAGTAIAAYYFGHNCEVIGAEPFEADDAYKALISGNIETNKSTNTIADGLRTQLGSVNFPIIKKYVHKIIRVEEVEIIKAMKLIFERLKIVVEPSSAIVLAAVIREKELFSNKKVGLIISGGNVDVTQLPF